MRNQHGNFIWYELMTADPDAAKAFYDPVAGWDIEPAPAGEMDYRMIRTASGNSGGVMRLTGDMTAHGARPTWLGYVGVDDVDATVAKAETLGAKTLMLPWTIPGIGRMAMIADPQGAPLYVMRGDSEDESTAFDPQSYGHVAWNELRTSDLDSARRFYTDLFGWTLGNVMPMGDAGDYQFLEHGGRMIGAIMRAYPGARVGWGFAVASDDIDGAVGRIDAKGGAITYGPAAVPGDQRVVMATDPEHVPFMLVGK